MPGEEPWVSGMESRIRRMAKSNDIRVLLARTGETEWEKDGRIVGHTDVPLSEGGRRAVADMARQLQGARISTVYCGPDEASLATANEIAAVTGARVKAVDCLSEMNLGLWEGLRQKELEEKCPRVFRQWMDDPSVVQVPEGETVEEAQERILSGLSKVLEKARTDNGAIAVVLRPVAMGLVACAINGVPPRNLWSIMKTCLAAQWQTLQRGFLRQGLAQTRASA
jgi:broad specificity phosphatase PhoE